MSSPPWQDRRGMFQTGKVLHEPAARRRSSASESKAAKPGGLATLAALAGTDTTPESSTKFIYRRGKEVHEGSAARKKSMSEDKPAAAPVAAEPGTAAVRKASTSSQSGGYNAVLNNPDYAARRESWQDMKTPGGFGGLFGGLLGKSPEKK